MPPELICVVQDGSSSSFNNKAYDITGYTKAELLSKSLLFAVHPEDQLYVIEVFSKSIGGENVPSNIEYRLVRKDGRTIWVETHGVLIQWEGRLATLGLISDITERKKLEEELKDSLRRIMELQEEERKLFANELHDDVGQYLALLKMQLAGLLKSKVIQNPKAVQKLRYLEKDAQHTLDSIRRFGHELRPAVLDNTNLTTTNEQLSAL
jgi:PAS domain S-box-containing protein